MKRLLLGFVFLGVATTASAQTQPVVTSATPTVSFVISSDYNKVVPGTTIQLVDGMKAMVVKQTATGSTLQTQDLGKPPLPDLATYTYTSQVLTTQNVVLQVYITTTGPGGSSASALSNR